MLPKQTRATTKVIEHIFQKGKFVNSPNLTFKFIPSSLDKIQISCIAPKAVAKSAVKRNLLRRRGYRALEKQLKNFPTHIQGALIFGKHSLTIFGAKKTKTYDPLTALEKEIEIILHKLY